MHIGLITVLVRDYDTAIDFFTGALGFDLVEDSPATTSSGQPKRWVVVAPPGREQQSPGQNVTRSPAAGVLLALAEGDEEHRRAGSQVGDRVGFFLQVDSFDEAYARMRGAGVTFAESPRTEAYGRVAVFFDISGNRWDLLGPA